MGASSWKELPSLNIDAMETTNNEQRTTNNVYYSKTTFIFLMVKAQLIDFSNPYTYGRLQSLIEKRQNGKCHKCGEPLVASDGIVARGYKRHYYHRECAIKLYII
jgi:hypothetical protein